MHVRTVLTLFMACTVAACVSVPNSPRPNGINKPVLAPKGYQRLFSPAEHAFRYSRIGEPTRRGQVSERFELRDEDCGGSDCAGLRNRSEIRQVSGETKARLNKDIWYGWSFYNDQIGSYTKRDSLKTVFGQWKLSGDTPPVFRIVQIGVGEGNWENCLTTICNRSEDKTADVIVQLEDMRRAQNWGENENFGNICKLFSMEQNRGKWVDLVVNTNFSTESDGYLRVWVNGILRCSYVGQLVATSPKDVRTPTNRRGIFISSSQRWRKQHPNTPKPTIVAYYDEFLVGKSRKKVDTILRESIGSAPKD
ncbi:MAG: polysaccharide lyase [Rhodobacteraceae bacterium]|nr:polysaccharide lyase [Paracoccaceae bacterium]